MPLMALMATTDFSFCAEGRDVPRIVNIINFVRAVEPRDSEITGDVLYDTVLEQAALMDSLGLKGTFLLQYDALVIPRYQDLMKRLLSEGFEVGGWWEITQPHVEQSGLKWRGRYPWDWHADVGFSTGYTPKEREQLVDTFMMKFKEIFGRYPASVGSWFIDAHTLGYMYEKYGITASCNCKDQVGTDGYTLWGGYWNQAYYPSRVNAYMPAQTADGQIPVPVFRMLGSDPVYQYDTGLGGSIQGVITLEPVYPDAGGNETWVRRFLDYICKDPCIGFNYTQAGQENSFTWAAMGKALTMQLKIIDSLYRAGDIRVETLAESGQWFKDRYRVTPPTSVTALEDTYGRGNGTVWYDSRFYRANILWNEGSIVFRDLHLFDQRIESDYLTRPGTSSQCIYRTCPVMDGFGWSSGKGRASIALCSRSVDSLVAVSPSEMKVRAVSRNKMELSFMAPDGAGFKVTMCEDGIRIKNDRRESGWCLYISVPEDKVLPLDAVEDGYALVSELKGIRYGIRFEKGCAEKYRNGFSIVPEHGEISIDCSLR